MSDWLVTTGLSSVISIIILKNNGPLIHAPFDYQNYRLVYSLMAFYLSWDNPKTWDYVIHHNINILGICWCMWFDKYYKFMGRILMYEMTTPWLGMYMMTKNIYMTPMILLTYSYYRIYNNIELFIYWKEVDIVVCIVHLVNTFLNFYWYSKILRKCYIKLIQ